MKKIMRGSTRLPKAFKLFIAVVTLLSILGGYQLYHLIYKLNDTSLQRTDQLLAIENDLDDASIALGRQIQEWKDMLLRVNDAELYGKHQKAFLDSSIGVQKALLRAKAAMQNDGMASGEIEQLRVEHKSLFLNYLLAQSRLSRRTDSYREVDRQVIGADRNLQQHIAAVKSGIEDLAEQQLNGTMSGQESSYLLISMLGAMSLLIMALVGFIFANYFQNHETMAAEY